MAKRIGILTSGGDCAGLNAVVRAAVLRARDGYGWTMVGIHNGTAGLLSRPVEAEELDRRMTTSTVLRMGGTILGTTNKGDPFAYPMPDGSRRDRSEEIIEGCRLLGLDALIGIGGDGSFAILRKLAQQGGIPFVGVPKTIDNDVGDSEFKLIDHTPGYGSTAKYWMHGVQCANEENSGSCPADPVLVLQAMGRAIGFIPAAARLADPNREMPLQIYLAERKTSLAQIAENVNAQLKKTGRVIVVVSEGLDLGDIGAVKDSFGHTSFSASQVTIAQMVVNYLNDKKVCKLNAKGAARANVPGTDQRHCIALASTTDLEEAYRSGQEAALLASRGESGYMSTILRNPGPIYSVRYDKVPLTEVANSERHFPEAWITKDGTDVTDDFVKYAEPLLGEDMVSLPMVRGRQRMTRFAPNYAKQTLAKYVPQADRS